MPNNREVIVKVDKNPAPWHNRHQNVVVDNFKRFYDIETPNPRDETQIIGDLRLTVAALKKIIGEADAAGVRLRCIGGAWSLSEVVKTDGWLINTRALNLYTPLGSSHVDDRYEATRNYRFLVYAQCGISVQELNKALANVSMALKTSGASNGQTIAGAVATGTHGSAYQFGSMTEYIVGIHLITGPGPDDNVWLERESYPVVTEKFMNVMGTRHIPSDELFNAALVSFGSCGIVHGVLIEAEPIYLLEAKRKRFPLDAVLRKAMRTLDFTQLLPGAANPCHFEVNFNPHDLAPDTTAKGPYVTTMYRRECPLTYRETPLTSGQLAAGNSLLSVMGKLTEHLDEGSVAALVNLLFKFNFNEFDQKLGTPGETFPTTDLEGKAMSMELGVALEDAEKVLNILLNAKPEVNVYAGVFSFRYVKRSSALLGFTRFDTTCTVEFNAAHNDRTLAYYRRVWDDLQKQNIPYTLHWGQMGNYSPGHVLAMYGPQVIQDWKKARAKLLSPAMQKVFSSPFLEQCGLA